MRHLDYVSQFTSSFRHIKGAENVVADALSRSHISALSTSTRTDFNKVALLRRECEELHHLRHGTSSLSFKDIPLPSCDTTVTCDMSTGSPRPFVPTSLRRAVFDSLHALSHPGIRATQRLITERYVWPGINKDVRQWAQSCDKCQRSKVHRHTKSPCGTFATPDARFDHVHIDIVGPLPPMDNHTS